MGDHYHLVMETPDGNLARGMRQLNGVYTQRFNARHERVGHVFQASPQRPFPKKCTVVLIDECSVAQIQVCVKYGDINSVCGSLYRV